MIDRQAIEDLFVNTRTLTRDGRAEWDIDAVCRWSFFFVDADRDRLMQAGEDLARGGYEVVGPLNQGEGDEDQETFYLPGDRIEGHTVDSLLSRNSELYAFAESHGLADYDGMDVGAIESP